MTDRMFVKDIIRTIDEGDARSSVLLAVIREKCLTELYGEHPSVAHLLGENID